MTDSPISRRDFMRQAATAVGGSALGTALGASASDMASRKAAPSSQPVRKTTKPQMPDAEATMVLGAIGGLLAGEALSTASEKIEHSTDVGDALGKAARRIEERRAAQNNATPTR